MAVNKNIYPLIAVGRKRSARVFEIEWRRAISAARSSTANSEIDEMTTRFQEIVVIVGLALVAAAIATYSAGSYPRGGAYAPLLSVLMYISLAPYVADIEWISSIRLFGFAHFLLCILLSVHLVARFDRAWWVSAALLLILLIANLVFYAIYSKFAVQYHGLGYVVVTGLLNMGLASLAGWQLLRSRQEPFDSVHLLLAHAVMLVWLSWVSLPMLGSIG